LGRRPGIFISLEGPDGAGKSTQARMLAAKLRQKGRRVTLTKEPGGSKGSLPIRALVLDAKGRLSPEAELLLFLADRAQHVGDTLLPALKAGHVVLCDRYSDSTFAYQGGGRGFGRAILKALNHFASGGLKPDLTLLFDLDAPRGLKRATRNSKDRMEAAGLKFHKRVRLEFIKLARREPRRVKLITVGNKTRQQIQAEAWAHVARVL
jgi:dTMP kinase